MLSNGALLFHRDLDGARREAPEGEEELQEVVMDGADDLASWLTSFGVEIRGPFEAFEDRRIWTIEPRQFVDAMRTFLLAAGVEFLPSQSMIGLSHEDGRVNGVHTIHPDGHAVDVDANAVVLATGGFQGNPEMLTRYALKDSMSVYHRANPWSTGDGLASALHVGARTSHGLREFYGHAMAAPPAVFHEMQFGELTQYWGLFAVAVNTAGQRFVDESIGLFEEHLNRALADQPHGLGFYIADAELMTRQPWAELPSVQVAIDRVRRAGGTVVDADGIDDLVDKLEAHGVHGATLRDTLVAYDHAVKSEEAHTLVPPRLRHQRPLSPGPLTAVAVKASITMTTGGISVTPDMEVVRSSSSSAIAARHVIDGDRFRRDAIPGLFAAGADVGGISHVGYLGGLGTAMITGRIAGARAATHASPVHPHDAP
jgi:succinate dehydrogenase/fumarate reductase flavoprotein subunit